MSYGPSVHHVHRPSFLSLSSSSRCLRRNLLNCFSIALNFGALSTFAFEIESMSRARGRGGHSHLAYSSQSSAKIGQTRTVDRLDERSPFVNDHQLVADVRVTPAEEDDGPFLCKTQIVRCLSRLRTMISFGQSRPWPAMHVASTSKTQK